MDFRSLMFGAAIMLSAGAANATVAYDSIDVGAGQLNFDNNFVDPTAGGPIASSFTTTAATSLTSVSLMLSANPNSGDGSMVVVLLPNNGGAPPYSTLNDPGLVNTNFGVLPTFNNVLATIGTVQDSSFVAETPKLVTFNTYAPLAANTTYWIGVYTPQDPSSIANGDSAIEGTYGNGEWWFTSANPTGGVGIGSAQNFDSHGGIRTFSAETNGAYELIVNTPEPGTMAILGAGLTGLGYFRRRAAKRA